MIDLLGRSSKVTLLAATAVLALLLVSDLSPHQIDKFEDLPDDGKPFEVVCMVTSSREAKGGTVLELRDSEGVVIEAYCPDDAWTDAPMPFLAYVTGRLDDGPDLFLFIDEIEPQL